MSHHTIKQAQHCDVIAALELHPFDLVAATLFLFGMRCQQTVVNIDAIATIRQLVELIDGSEQDVWHRDRCIVPVKDLLDHFEGPLNPEQLTDRKSVV